MSKITKGLLLGLASTVGFYYIKNPNEAKKHKDIILDNLKGGLEKISGQSSDVLENTVEEAEQIIENNIVISDDAKEVAQKKLDNLIAAFDDNENELEFKKGKTVSENYAEPEYEVEEPVINEEFNEGVIYDYVIEETSSLKGNDIDGGIEEGVELTETLEESIENDFSTNIEEKEPTFEHSVEDQKVPSLIENYEVNELKEEVTSFVGVEVPETKEVNLHDVIEKVKEEISKEEIIENKDIDKEEEFEVDEELEDDDKKSNEAKSALESIVSLFSSKNNK